MLHCFLIFSVDFTYVYIILLVHTQLEFFHLRFRHLYILRATLVLWDVQWKVIHYRAPTKNFYFTFH